MLLDIHTHVIRQHGPPRSYGDDFVTAEEIIPMLDRCGIGRAVVLPIVSPECQHVM